MKKILCLLPVLTAFAGGACAQGLNRVMDSLQQLVTHGPNDTVKARALILMGETIYETSPQKAVSNWEKAAHIASRKNSNATISKTLAVLRGDALNNIAIVYFFQGNVPQALEKNFESLRVREKAGDVHGMAESMNNIANVYLDQGDTLAGLDFLQKSNARYAQINDLGGVAYTYINTAKIYIGRKNDSLALEYLEKARAILEKRPDLKAGLAGALNRMGNIYKRRGQMQQARQLLHKAMRLRLESNDIIGISSAYTSLAAFYDDDGKPDSALYYARLAMNEKLAPLDSKADAALVASRIYDRAGRYREALQYYQSYIAIRDSISNDKTRKLMLRNQYKYAYENKVATDSLQHAEEKKLNAAKLEKEKTKQYALFAVLGVILVFSVFLYNRFRLIKKQKNIIEDQKKQVEQQRDIVAAKQKEIIDSIHYAQHIQNAILAREEHIRKYFPHSFLFYRPKDIVAGDFYFFETTATHLFYAAADCTGHGVPGAMVSVVCSNALNRCVKELHLTSTGTILDKTRELVIETFEKSGQHVNDGMDISLVSINLEDLGRMSRGETKSIPVQWSGANNPLWIISGNGNQAPALAEIKGNKQPVGISVNAKPFTTHHVTVETGTNLYLLTDGYADQFGGTNGKKFKNANLQKLLLEIAHLDMPAQLAAIDNRFEQWKNHYEQLDDVCVIGIKL